MNSGSPFTARIATPDDHPVFARLFPELGVQDPLPDREDFAQQMLPRVLVLCDGPDPIAYATWQIHGCAAHVVQLVVDPRARGRGAGRALMAAVRAIVIGDGCTRWGLNVKRDNLPAIRLYERFGMRAQYDAWAMRVGWAQACAFPSGVGAPVAFTPRPEDDATIAARFAIDQERITRFRSRPGFVLAALREHGAIAAFAAFDTNFPRVFPFRVARVELAAPLFNALREHARADRPEIILLVVEADRALFDALRGAGAELLHELIHMGAPLTDSA